MPPATPSGVFTLADAPAAGWSDAAVRRHVKAGRWLRIHPAVFTAGCVCLTPLGRARAVALATGGVPSHQTAAAALALWVVDDGDRATLPAGVRRGRRAGIQVSHRDLAADDVVAIGGVTVTAPLRTVVDLCLRGSRLQAVVAIESAVRRNLLTPEQLAELRRHPDVRVRRRATVADVRSESPLETAVRLLLLDAGIVTEPQWTAYDYRGMERYRIDLAIARLRIAIECDGARWHDGVHAAYRDRSRHNRVQADGWWVLRFTWWDVDHRPDYVVATVRQAVARCQRQVEQSDG